MPSCWSRRTGHLKKPYASEGEARRQPMNRYQVAYYCLQCAHWHVGKKTKKGKSRKKKGLSWR